MNRTVTMTGNRLRTASSVPSRAPRFSFDNFCHAAIALGPEGAATLGSGMTPRQEAIKRVSDVVLSAAALVLLGPLFGLIALGIKLSSPGPVLFKQERVGRDGRLFTILKFRTMRRDASAAFCEDGRTLVEERDQRVFPFGRFLRRGLDELPQLINVLRGDMSLIGPRPDEPCHLRHYRAGWTRKLLVRPGITGLPQVCGRRNLSWVDRVALDVAYTSGFRPGIEAGIILRTAQAIIRNEGNA